MSNLELKRSWLAQLFFGRAQSMLTHQPAGLGVAGSGQRQLLPFSRMQTLAEVKHGLFWSGLYITTARKTYQYRGFSRRQLQQLSASLNDDLQRFVEQQLKAEFTETNVIKNELRAFLDGSTYRRDSQCKQMVKRCLFTSAVSVDLRAQFATPRQQSAMKYLSEFVTSSAVKVKRHNAKFIRQEEIRLKSFFDTLEKNPLTAAQRRACIVNEDHNLVLAGAGTGKTSTMIGRAGYLVATGQANPDQILMLAFAKKAAEEMQERQDKCLSAMLKETTPSIRTFHALGLEIINNVEARYPVLSAFAEDKGLFHRFVGEVVGNLMNDQVYQHKVIQFCDSSPDINSMTEFSQLLADFLILFKQSNQTLAELKKQIAKRDKQRFAVFIELFEPLLLTYQQHLASRKEIDFSDMIGKAIEYIETGRYCSPYTHILVDEFQDISQARTRLIKALLTQRNDTVLFAVGDDWQAIYQFSGSDLNVTKHFSHFFGATAVTALDTTFRFNNKIGEVASRFVLQNPSQLVKKIDSISQVSQPAISLLPQQELQIGLQSALKAIQQKAEKDKNKNTSVLVLARFNFLLAEMSLMLSQRQYPLLDIELMSVHASKGKESDYVIILGMNQGKYGFPCQKEGDPVLAILLPEKEFFQHAEERRLFYVALTRARHHVYVVFDPANPSPFISELINQKYSIHVNEFSDLT
jgi:DNA helicase IV